MPVSWDVSPVVRCNMSFFFIKGRRRTNSKAFTCTLVVFCGIKKKKKVASKKQSGS